MATLAGTIYDSAGQHVDIWCATLTWVDNGAEQQHHVAMFYDKEQVNGEKNKNSNTGMMALRRLVILVLSMCAAFVTALSRLTPRSMAERAFCIPLFRPRRDWSSLGTLVALRVLCVAL
jgi:hypothetical protein